MAEAKPSSTKSRVLVLLLDSEDFQRNRRQLLEALSASGADVLIMAGDGEDASRFDGFPVIGWSVARGGHNLFVELRSLFQVWRVYLRFTPTLAYLFSMKPVVYGGIAARLAGSVPFIAVLTGVGAPFKSPSWRNSVVRRLVISLLRIALHRSSAHTVFQNPDDRAMWLAAGVTTAERTTVIRGSGVDINTFRPCPEPKGPPVIMFVGRMMREKGVEDFVEAARLVRSEGMDARFVLVGAPDPAHRSSITELQLQSWVASGVVEWWGVRTNMPEVISAATIVCLPSYREGLPNVLLEAAACSRPLIGTDAPGCREIVIDGRTGLRVPVQAPGAIAEAITEMLTDPIKRKTMGANARRLVVTEFARETVVNELLELRRRFESDFSVPQDL